MFLVCVIWTLPETTFIEGSFTVRQRPHEFESGIEDSRLMISVVSVPSYVIPLEENWNQHDTCSDIAELNVALALVVQFWSHDPSHLRSHAR
jgi:hypothetical protein